MIKPDDKQILELIANPKTRDMGFRQLIQLYQERIYYVIRRMVLIHEDADDLTQNTFIKAHTYIDKFKGQSSLFTWLYRIATNESLTFLEKKKKQYYTSLDTHENHMESYLDHSGVLGGDQIQILLQKTLLKLPEKQRLVFHFRYQDDLTYEQISEITGTSIGALKASYHHAVKKIEKYLLED